MADHDPLNYFILQAPAHAQLLECGSYEGIPGTSWSSAGPT